MRFLEFGFSCFLVANLLFSSVANEITANSSEAFDIQPETAANASEFNGSSPAEDPSNTLMNELLRELMNLENAINVQENKVDKISRFRSDFIENSVPNSIPQVFPQLIIALNE